MLKHTPGPWHFHKKESEAAFRIDAKGDEWQELATVYQVPPYTHLMEQGEANARLIAAAPEMLDALKLARAHVQWRVSCEFNAGAPPTGTKAHAALVALDAAIAKAEGEVSNA